AAVTGSTLNLSILPLLRDYAKAPFLLCAVLIMGCIVTRASTRPAVFALAAAGGVVMGVGLGFRNDLLLVVVPFVFVLTFLLPQLPRPVTARLIACAVFAAAFGLSAAPVLADYTRGTNTGHVTVLGLSAPFDAPLGIAPSIYEYGHFYLDTSAAAIITTYADR